MSIVLGLPKGSLQDSTFALFKRAGFNVTCSSRSYTPTIDDEEIKCRLLRPQEMSRYVELGLLDAGICGWDWVYENGSDVQEICVGLVKRYLKKNHVKADVEFSWGATEVKAPELVDAIVDLTETGSSLRANNLRIVDTILVSTTRFIANKASWRNKAKRAKLEQLRTLLTGALEAQRRVLLKCNAPKSSLDRVVKEMPALHAPTVNALHGGDWFAVESVVEERKVRDLIPALKSAGATGIIELPLNKIIF